MADPGRGAILIVDSNVGFATMLQESLEQDGNYRTAVAHRGSEALRTVAHETFDLAIVDLGVDAADDLDGATVARRLRQKQTNLRLMLIPLEGDELPDAVADLDVQSVLSKPFFLPDLPELIENVLAQPMAELPQSEEIGQSDTSAIRSAADDGPKETSYAVSPHAIRELEDLAQEIGAEMVLLTHNGEVLGSVGPLSTETVSELTQIVQHSYQSSNRIAEILGRERRRFEQSLEGGDYVLYSLSVIEDVILCVALRSAIALGIVRHRAKAAARRLRDEYVSS